MFDEDSNGITFSPMLGAAVASLAATSAIAAPRGFTVEDLVDLERVGSPAVSPDASRVVYTVRSTDMDKNRGNTRLWIADIKGAAAPSALSKHDAAAPIPNGRPRATPSTSCPRARAFPGLAPAGRRRRAGQGHRPAARRRQFPRSRRTGDRIAFSLAVFRDCADLACTKARLDAQAKNKASGKVYDRLFVRHWDTWADGRNAVLFSAPLDAAAR